MSTLREGAVLVGLLSLVALATPVDAQRPTPEEFIQLYLETEQGNPWSRAGGGAWQVSGGGPKSSRISPMTSPVGQLDRWVAIRIRSCMGHGQSGAFVCLPLIVRWQRDAPCFGR